MKSENSHEWILTKFRNLAGQPEFDIKLGHQKWLYKYIYFKPYTCSEYYIYQPTIFMFLQFIERLFQKYIFLYSK